MWKGYKALLPRETPDKSFKQRHFIYKAHSYLVTGNHDKWENAINKQTCCRTLFMTVFRHTFESKLFSWKLWRESESHNLACQIDHSDKSSTHVQGQPRLNMFGKCSFAQCCFSQCQLFNGGLGRSDGRHLHFVFTQKWASLYQVLKQNWPQPFDTDPPHFDVSIFVFYLR